MIGPVEHFEGALTWMHELWEAVPQGNRCKLRESHEPETRIRPEQLHYIGTINDDRELLYKKGMYPTANKMNPSDGWAC